MAREMKLCLSAFVPENGKIKYLAECLCRILRVGVEKYCKKRADGESRPLLKYIREYYSARKNIYIFPLQSLTRM